MDDPPTPIAPFPDRREYRVAVRPVQERLEARVLRLGPGQSRCHLAAEPCHERGRMIGHCDLSQATEILVFQDKAALENFKNGTVVEEDNNRPFRFASAVMQRIAWHDASRMPRRDEARTARRTA